MISVLLSLVAASKALAGRRDVDFELPNEVLPGFQPISTPGLLGCFHELGRPLQGFSRAPFKGLGVEIRQVFS